MGTDVLATDAPAVVLERAGSFLEHDPVRHNLIMTLLEARVAHPEPGRYWVASVDGAVGGVAMQSPTNFFATLTPMPLDVVTAVVDAIVEQGVDLPGVNGDAATAARFAGHWTQRRRTAAHPIGGQRIYEVDEVVSPPAVDGAIRLAATADRDLLVDWFEAFEAEAGAGGGLPVGPLVDQRLTAGQLWIWEHGTTVALAGHSDPVAGTVRVGPVYTPPACRGRGYASALVATVSRAIRERGHRCILYTDLANATSNSIYRALGYRAVEEGLRYHFGP